MNTTRILTRLLLGSLVRSRRRAQWPTKRQQVIQYDRRTHRGRWTQAGWRRDMSKGAIYRRCNGRCGICGGSVAWQDINIDHIIPLARGGRHEPDNVQLSHAACNRWKGARIL